MFSEQGGRGWVLLGVGQQHPKASAEGTVPYKDQKSL